MAALTCTQTNDSINGLQHGKLSPVHFCDSAVSSPFLYIPSDAQANKPASKREFGLTISPFFLESEHPFAQSLKASSEEEETFYTAFRVTDINPRPDYSPPISNTDSGSPRSAFSMSTADEDALEAQTLIKPSTQASGRDENISASIPKPSHRKPTETHSRNSSCSTKNRSRASHMGSSRSSSASRYRGGRLRSKSGVYSRLHQAGPLRAETMPNSGRVERDLVAYYRESCRLFKQPEPDVENDNKNHENNRDLEVENRCPAHSGSRASSGRYKEYISADTPSASPLLLSGSLPASPLPSEGLPSNIITQGRWDPVAQGQRDQTQGSPETAPQRKQLPQTVIEWNSPSTRRREYSKIDRETHGIRGMWRKFAPRCLQSRDQRTLFFDEGKPGKEQYEGSVRRFRMDIPDEDEAEKKDAGFSQGKGFVSNLRRSWTAHKISPQNDDISDAPQAGKKNRYSIRRRQHSIS